jgi:hypothetical protein
MDDPEKYEEVSDGYYPEEEPPFNIFDNLFPNGRN